MRLVDEEDILAQGTMTPVQAAKFTGLSRATIWNLMNAGDLPFACPPGLRVRVIPVVSLKNYLRATLRAGNGRVL